MMTLDRAFIEKGIFQNCLEVIETEEGILPLRFTQKQLTEYAKTEMFRIRSLCPAGVCLDMYTDSSFVEFEYAVKDRSRDWIFFDVYLNGILIDSMGSKPIQQASGRFRYDIPVHEAPAGEFSVNGRKRNRITVYLPHIVQVVLHNFQVSPGANVEAAGGPERNLLCLGDSITQGMDARHPSSTYPVQLSRFLGMNLLNQGVGGYTFASESLDRELPFQPDLVTVAYGTNDWGKCSSRREFQNNCSRYISELVTVFRRSKIYVLTPFWRSGMQEAKNTGTLFDVSGDIVEICSKYPEISVINGLELMPNISGYTTDQLHPTDEGFLHIAMNLAKKLRG